MENTNSPLVIILIPTLHNRKELLGKALQSCISQTYPNYLVFVVGDGVNYDGYLDIELNDKIKFFASSRGQYPESGMARWHIVGREPLNYGFKLVKRYNADIVCRLDDDDQYLPDHLQTIVEQYNQGKNGIVYTLPTFLDGTVYHTGLKEFSPELLQRENVTFTCTLAFCGKQIIDDLYFVNQHAIPGDWHMALTLLRKGYKFYKVNKTTSLHRHEAHHSSRKEIK